MSTTTVFARGSEWGWSIYDGWGDVTDVEAHALANLVVTRFEELATEAGDPTIRWLPHTSEVHGEVYGQDTDEHSKWDEAHPIGVDLSDMREQAISEVWDALMGDETPMSARVQTALEHEYRLTVVLSRACPAAEGYLIQVGAEHLEAFSYQLDGPHSGTLLAVAHTAGDLARKAGVRCSHHVGRREGL